MKSKCTNIRQETCASLATPNSMTSRVEPENPSPSNCEKLVGLNPSECDQADDSPYPKPDKELSDTTQEVESATTSEDLKVANIEFGQLPEDGDLVALDVYIEELPQVLDTDEELKFLPEELDFDMDEVLADIHTFLGKEHSVVVITSIATAGVNPFPGEEHIASDPRELEDKHGRPEGISHEGKCFFKVVDTTFATEHPKKRICLERGACWLSAL